MDKEKNTPRKDYSVDEVLEDAKGRFGGKSYAELIGEGEEGAGGPRKEAPAPEEPAPAQPRPEIEKPAPQPEPQPARPVPGGEVRFEKEEKPKKGFFRKWREKKASKCDFQEEDDIYYGIQLKGVEEYRKGYNDEEEEPSSSFSYLFDETDEEEIDRQIAERFSAVRKQEPSEGEKRPEKPENAEEIASIYSHTSLTPRRPVKVDFARKTESVRKVVQEDAGETGKTLEFRLPVRPAEPAPEEKPAEPVSSQPVPEEKPAEPVSPQPVPEEKPAEPVSSQAVPEEKSAEPVASQPAAAKPLHVVDVGLLDTALENEAMSYASPAKEEKNPEKTQPEGREKERVHKKFSLLGDEEEENDPSEELPEEPSELDDYNDPADAPSVLHDIGAHIRELMLRLTVTGILGVLLLILGLLSERYPMLPETLQLGISPMTYLIVNLVFVAVAMAFCAKTVWNGLKGLFRLQANSDSSVAVAAAAVLIQSAAAFFAQGRIEHGQIHLYAVLAVWGLFLNTAGKLSLVRRVGRNFRFAASPEPKYSVELYDDYNMALQFARGCVSGTPEIAYQTRTDFLKHFLHNSYEPDPSELQSQTIAPIAFVSSLVLCGVCAFLSRSAVSAVTAFTAAACISAPFCNMLCVNLPMGRLCKLGKRCGTMLIGYRAVEKFCNVNAVMLDAKDLFPKGTVILNGIKTFGGQRIDDAIVDATALMCAVGGPLSDLFDQIIKSHQDMLPKVSNLSYEDELGVVGWINGRRLLVGNRSLMLHHSIDTPSLDYEQKYLAGGKQVAYLAAGGELVAMFVLSYNSDKRRALELQRLENSGVSLIVRTTDPNITPEFLAQCFQLDPRSIQVMPEKLGKIYRKLTEKPVPRSNAVFATKGRPTTMMRMLTACIREKGNVSLAVVLQNIAVALGFVLVAFLSCYSGLQQLSTLSLLLYELFWLLVLVFLPKLRKP